MKIIGYMYQVDWQYELGEASDGTKVYPSIEDLKKHRTCWKSCGIVEVLVEKTKEVSPQNLFRSEDENL